MREHFKSEYSDHDAFYARVALLRPGFGAWDAYDPISDIILDLVEAQSELSDLFEDGEYGLDCEAAFKAAVDKRHDAGRRLLAALEDRNSWPDPDLGRR
jgi:hypothetical protein